MSSERIIRRRDENADPVNRITSGDARVGQRRVCLRPRLCVIPPVAALCVDFLKLGEATDVGAIAEVIDDEALHACSLRGVDQGDLVHDAAGANNTDGGILPRECLGQCFECVLGFDDGDSGGEG